MAREFYNVRHGYAEACGRLDFPQVTAHVQEVFEAFGRAGYFQKAFGSYCYTFRRRFEGEIDETFKTELLLRTGIKMSDDTWILMRMGEVNFFTFLEFIHAYVAKPVSTPLLRCRGDACTPHYVQPKSVFDVEAGRNYWRQKVNRYLAQYKDGYELSPEGEVRQLAPRGFEDLLARPAPEDAPPTNAEKLDHAIRAFRRANASRVERKQAVRELADLLEFYKESVMKEHLTADAKELFNIVNNFSIRHHHEVQRDNYSDEFVEYMFFRCLSAVQLCMKLAHEETQEDEPEP